MRILLAAAIAAVAVPVLAAQDHGAARDSVEADLAAAAILADCNARKFETSVELEKGGKKRLTKLKLCAGQDKDEASWARTLKDAKAKISGHPDISAESKAKIVAELEAEIAKVEAGTTVPAERSASPISRPVTKSAGSAQFENKTAVDMSVAASASPSVARLAVPRLKIQCLAANGTGLTGRCGDFHRSTILSIRAEENLTGDVRLRFLGRGKMKAELALAGLRKGQTIRPGLPRQLCVGEVTSELEIQIMSSGQVVDALGPFQLRC